MNVVRRRLSLSYIPPLIAARLPPSLAVSFSLSLVHFFLQASLRCTFSAPPCDAIEFSDKTLWTVQHIDISRRWIVRELTLQSQRFAYVDRMLPAQHFQATISKRIRTPHEYLKKKRII